MAGSLKALVSKPMPDRPCFDFSGVVLQVGEDVTSVAVGDEVFGMTAGLRTGTIAEFLTVDEKVCTIKPANLTHAQAAAVPLAALTALQCFDVGRLPSDGSGEVLVTGGPGGVGTFAIQIAKAMFKAKTIATTASTKKVELCENLGATDVVDYKTTTLSKALKDKKFDVCMDCNEQSAELRKFLKPTGGLVSISLAPTTQILTKWINAAPKDYPGAPKVAGAVKFLAFKCPAVVNLATGAWWHRHRLPGKNQTFDHVITCPTREDLSRLVPYLESGEIKPVIDTVYPFEKAVEAFEHSESGRAVGKIVVEIVSSTT